MTSGDDSLTERSFSRYQTIEFFHENDTHTILQDSENHRAWIQSDVTCDVVE